LKGILQSVFEYQWELFDPPSFSPLQFGPIKGRKPRVGAEDILKQFAFFGDHRFREPRARCLYCNHEMVHRLVWLQGHLSKCPKLPKEVIRPSAQVASSSKCKQRFLQERLAEHFKGCQKTQKCTGCQQWLPESHIQKHKYECRQKFRKCEKCRKARTPVEKWEAHIHACQFKRCTACGKSIQITNMSWTHMSAFASSKVASLVRNVFHLQRISMATSRPAPSTNADAVRNHVFQYNMLPLTSALVYGSSVALLVI